MPKYCYECGGANPELAQYCQRCGAPLDAGVERQSEQPGIEPEVGSIGGSNIPDTMPGTMFSTIPSGTAGLGGQVPGEQPRTRLQVGGVGARVVAYIIDVIILEIILYLLGYIPAVASLSNYTTTVSYDLGDGNTLLVPIITNYGLLALDELYISFIYFLYFGLLEANLKGRTIGKALLSLASVNERDGTPVTGQQAFLNAITKSNIILVLLDLLIGYLSQANRLLKQIRVVQRKTSEVIVKATVRGVSRAPTTQFL